MEATQKFTYPTLQGSFEINDAIYSVTLAEDLFAGEEGLDNTGNYYGILIHPERGTVPFQLEYVDEKNWRVNLLQVQDNDPVSETAGEDLPNASADEKMPVLSYTDYVFSDEVISNINKIIQ